MASAGVTTLLTNVLPIAAGLAVLGELMPGGSAGLVRWLGFAGAVIGATLLTGRERAGPDRAGSARTRRSVPAGQRPVS